MKAFVRENAFALATGALGVFAVAYMALLLEGQLFFDNDYDWINAAQDGWLTILGQVVDPIPEQWGFQERPVQTLVFKVLYGIFGYTPAGYYAFKAILVALLALAVTRFARAGGLGTETGLVAGAVIVLASPTYASARWISDFELLAQCLIVTFFGAFLVFDRLDRAGNLTRAQFWLWQSGLFGLALVAHRTKGSAKLIPAIILAYVLATRRRAIVRYLPLVCAIGLTIVPVGRVLTDPVPPFAPFAADQSQGWKWRPANLETLGLLVFGNTSLFTGTADLPAAFSIASVLCPVLFWASVASALGVALRRGRAARTVSPGVLFTGIWAAVSITSYASFPRLPEGFMARYVLVGLVPVSLLVARQLNAASAQLARGYRAVAFAAILLAFGWQNFQVARYERETIGQVIVAYDRARRDVSESIRDADVVLAGFTYSWNRPVEDGNRYLTGKYEADADRLERPLYVLVRSDQDPERINHELALGDIRRAIRIKPGVDTAFRVGIRPVQTYSGLTDSFYDRVIYRDPRSIVGLLYEVTFDPVPAARLDAASNKDSAI